MNIEQIAEVCFEANKKYAEFLGEPPARFEDVKNSICTGIAALVADPSMTPEQLHKSWYDHKVAQGWRYGPEKDFEEKTHPQLVLYSQLPEEQRVKDYLFQAIVRVLARLPKGYVTV